MMILGACKVIFHERVNDSCISLVTTEDTRAQHDIAVITASRHLAPNKVAESVDDSNPA